MEELAAEIMEKNILHWNCRGFTDLPEELKAGHQVQEIYLKWNNLDCLPSWITNFKNLTNLYLQHNQLVNLPEELSEVSNLNVLDVSNNKIQVFPRSLANLSNLTHLMASDNQLKFIPIEFQKLKLLQVLDLRNNNLQFFPEDILECQALREITLDNNNLTTLPDSIVYLPLLEILSVSGNNILYLPFQPFMSNPTLIFENNFNLNYISIWLGQQISSRNARGFNENAWNLSGAQGCFEKETAQPLVMNNGDLVVKEEVSKNFVSLILPTSLKQITSGPNCQPLIPSLLELALRASYHTCYHHLIEKEENDVGSSTTYRLKRYTLNNQDYKCLPSILQRRLKSGPVAPCYYCRGPLFTFGVIWLVLKECYSDREAGHQLNVMSITLFCSVPCSILYTKWERQSNLPWKMEPQKLTWYSKNMKEN